MPRPPKPPPRREARRGRCDCRAIRPAHAARAFRRPSRRSSRSNLRSCRRDPIDATRAHRKRACAAWRRYPPRARRARARRCRPRTAQSRPRSWRAPSCRPPELPAGWTSLLFLLLGGQRSLAELRLRVDVVRRPGVLEALVRNKRPEPLLGGEVVRSAVVNESGQVGSGLREQRAQRRRAAFGDHGCRRIRAQGAQGDHDAGRRADVDGTIGRVPDARKPPSSSALRAVPRDPCRPPL